MFCASIVQKVGFRSMCRMVGFANDLSLLSEVPTSGPESVGH